MTATRSDIDGWFNRGVAQGSTHLIVKCGGFGSDCCYPVFVTSGQVALDVANKNSDRTMEVYNLSMDKSVQLNAPRSFNF